MSKQYFEKMMEEAAKTENRDILDLAKQISEDMDVLIAMLMKRDGRLKRAEKMRKKGA